MKGHLMNIRKGVKSSLKRYTKVIILIFSAILTINIAFFTTQHNCFLPEKYTKCTKVYAAELNSTEATTELSSTEATTEISTSSANIATAGDAEFLYQERTLTDIYNVLVCILVVFVFWIAWNIARVIVRILTDFRKY